MTDASELAALGPTLAAAPATTAFRLRARLYVRIYLALLASILLAGCLLWGIWYWDSTRREVAAFDAFAELISRVLPPASAPAEVQLRELRKSGSATGIPYTLYASDHALIGYVGEVLPAPDADRAHSGWIRPGAGIFALKLSDGRWVVGRRIDFIPHRPVQVAVILALVALAFSIGAYPLARRLTKRLEKLQMSVEALGAGDLKTRVDEGGFDEVARLAKAFNQAAARIEAVLASHKALLANASHELRSPLARIRMAVELTMQAGDEETMAQRREKMGEELRKNIVELDQLVEEILLASRLEAHATHPVMQVEELDFTALVAEECARAGAEFSGVQVELNGDPRLLRRLVRNLLENGRRYGGGIPVEVVLTVQHATTQLDVCDRGAGIPGHLRERIFEPFFRVPGVRESDGGVGLGLALVRTIAASHGGQVRCEAREGGGSRFSLTLPLA